MNSTRLERAVARATGEPLVEIRRRGFGLVRFPDPGRNEDHDDRPPLVADWDAIDAQRVRLFP